MQPPSSSSPRLPAFRGTFSIGIEGTLEPVSGRHTLGVSGHYRSARWRDDFALVRQLGLAEVRYPIPWHDIERQPGRYHWRRLDEILENAIAGHGLRIIADPLHHTSYPRWLEHGFLDAQFEDRYVAFVEAFARRYPGVTHFTPFNEPTCTLDFCGARGFWHPYAKGDDTYVTMLRHTARATARVIQTVRAIRPGAFILHVDTFQRHAALDRASRDRAAFLNDRRFLFEELIAGRIDRAHPLHGYLRRHGFSAEDVRWHRQNAVTLDERGGNYYPLNEEQLLAGHTRHAPSFDPVGLVALVREYAERVPTPLSLTETNIQGTARDRIAWLKYILECCEILQADGIALRRFAWYPLFDCAGWNSLLQGRRWRRDPQGVFTCTTDWQRESSEFSEIYRAVAQGLPSSRIPAYAFSPAHDVRLSALKRLMRWQWIDPASATPTASPARRAVTPAADSAPRNRLGANTGKASASRSRHRAARSARA